MCAVVRLRALMARQAARLITNPPIMQNSASKISDNKMLTNQKYCLRTLNDPNLQSAALNLTLKFPCFLNLVSSHSLRAVYTASVFCAKMQMDPFIRP
jgi:hypothetical protein